MCSRGVLVHRLSGLGAAVAVMAAEIPRGNGVFTKWALKRAKASHHCDRVISHNFKCSRIFRCNSELKLPSPLSAMNRYVGAACRSGLYADQKMLARTLGPSLSLSGLPFPCLILHAEPSRAIVE
jgi:hypothetical protein